MSATDWQCVAGRQAGGGRRGETRGGGQARGHLTGARRAVKIRSTMEFKRLFTQREAESALPLVRRIVADILETAHKIRQLEENDDERPGLEAELEENLHELEAMGCYFKDWNFSIGLVDFPAMIDGETVFLCWRSDEKELAWYHRIEDGFQGRKPLPGMSTSNN
jgi:hypothetical protein